MLTELRTASRSIHEYTPLRAVRLRAALCVRAVCEQDGALRRDGEAFQAHRFAGRASDPCDPSGVVARVERSRRAAVGCARRGPRGVAEDGYIADRAVVVSAGFDFRWCNR